MKKFLFAVAMLLLISSKQRLACDYKYEKSVLREILETRTYYKMYQVQYVRIIEKVSYQLKMAKQMEK